MMAETPRHHHYAPQFYLRNFASDPERRKIATVAKNGDRAIWSERSIERLGAERDFYVHMSGDTPVSVEAAINRRLETPLSRSQTWRKIVAGEASALDASDRPILYALIRHLHARTPLAAQTARQLAEMAASPASAMPFSADERAMYAEIRRSPGGTKAYANAMASELEWAEADYEGCGISIYRSPIPLLSSTTPVLAVKAPANPALSLPLPGMTPFVRVLPLDRFTLASLAVGDFDGAFLNQAITADEARGFNQQYVGQFAFFDTVRHLIAPRDGLAPALTWAPYDYVEEDARKVVFRRRPGRS